MDSKDPNEYGDGKGKGEGTRMSRGSKGKRVDRKGVRGGMFFVLFFFTLLNFTCRQTMSDHHNGGMNGHH